ncbi:hypothetical protein Hanom_Chr06g00565731 [Helianthus anomalus]
MDSRMLCFRCCFNVLVVINCFCFLNGLGCSKLDCIDFFIMLDLGRVWFYV